MIPPVLSQVAPPGTTNNGVPGARASFAYGNPGVASRDNRPQQGFNYAPQAGSPPSLGGYWRGSGVEEPGGIGAAGVVTRDVKQPGGPNGGDVQGHVWAPGVMNPPRTPWKGGANFALDGTIARDRHIMIRNMEPRTGTAESVPGNPPNPDARSQGEPRPVDSMLNRSINKQQGSDNDANQDDKNRGYSTTNDGRQFIGEQGSGWSPVYGGVPGLYQPYGSYSGYTANAYGEGNQIQSPVGQGQPGDGPRKVWSGPPHGLHSQTQPDYMTSLGRYMAIPQMHAPRVDRPANSKIAGQDYSQTVQPQGQTGTVAQSPVVGSQRYQSQSRFSETGGISGN
jgi:hypothetical protein